MPIRTILTFAALTLIALLPAAHAATTKGAKPVITTPTKSAPRTAGYSVIDGEFADSKRGGRIVPYKLYAPEKTEGPAPVVIFSHGLGGSTGAAAYFGQSLAVSGYYVFHIQHAGSDESIWKGKRPVQVKRAMRDAIKDMDVVVDRYKDVSFVIDELEKLNASGGALEGMLDLSRIGMAGHSFGARGTMAAAGENVGRAGSAFKDPRIKAAVALSPNLPMEFLRKPPGEAELANNYAAVDIPVFHITGTADGDGLGLYGGDDFDPATRTIPYEAIAAPEQYLLVLEGADHGSFGGVRAKGTDYARYQDATALGAALFFDAYLKGDAGAKIALRRDFTSMLKPSDRFEYK